MQMRGPRAERDVGAVGQVVLRLALEAVGDEGLGPLPQQLVPVDQPRADHDDGPRLDLAPADLVLAHGHPGVERRRRIQAHRFQQHGAKPRPFLQIGQHPHLVRPEGLHLRPQARLLGLVPGQQVGGPEQHPRGGLEARADEGRDLVADLRVGHARAGVRILGLQQQVQQVARLFGVAVPRLLLRPPLRDDAAHLFQPAAAEQRAPRRQEGQERLRRGQGVPDHRPSRTLHIGPRQLGQPPSPAADRHGEQGAAGRVQRRLLEGEGQVLARRLAEVAEQRLGRRLEVGDEQVDVVGREGRGQHAPLLPPLRSLGQHQALARGGAHQPAGGDRLVIQALGVPGRHVAHALRVVDHQGRHAEALAAEHLHFVGALAPDADGAPGQLQHEPPQRQRPLGRDRRRRDKRLASRGGFRP